jgi:uncharacterized protein YxjI
MMRKPVNSLISKNLKSLKLPKSVQAENSTNHLPSNLKSMLNKSALVVGRQIEMLNVFLGYEQANKYVIYDAETSKPEGFIMEANRSLAAEILRQIFRTHRSFTADILASDGQHLMRIERPFQWWISRMKVYIDDVEIGQVHQRFHLFRRQYDLFKNEVQFAEIDAPWLSWDFHCKDENGKDLAVVNKNFLGFGREIFTDTSHYVIRYDSLKGLSDEEVEKHGRSLTFHERAIVLAAAISIDFDYFSRSSGSGGLFRWLPFAGLFGGGED